MTLHENRPIDVINYKLSKLDSIFANLSGIENDRSLLYTEPNFKKREEIQARKGKIFEEEKENSYRKRLGYVPGKIDL